MRARPGQWRSGVTQLLLFNIFNGLIIGAFYALMALGLSLIINLTNVINFAHGGFLALGAYFAYMLVPYVGFWGALILAPLCAAVVGVIRSEEHTSELQSLMRIS